jgi:hypothetical protein
MSKNLRLSMAATVYMLILLGSRGIAMSQEPSKLVDTGVIFSKQQIERSPSMKEILGSIQPLWTPSPEEVALLEGKLKAYLESLADRRARSIAARLGSYKRQYFGYTYGGKKWIHVNGFCESYWKRDDSWRDRFVYVLDGGSCYFRVHYDPSSSQFDKLSINGEA